MFSPAGLLDNALHSWQVIFFLPLKGLADVFQLKFEWLIFSTHSPRCNCLIVRKINLRAGNRGIFTPYQKTAYFKAWKFLFEFAFQAFGIVHH